MLIEQQELRLLERGHQQCQCLTLAAGEQANLCGHSVLKAEAEGAELLAELLALCVGHGPAQPALFAAAHGERHVLFDLHVRRGAHHRILEHAAYIPGTLVLRQGSDVHPIKDDAPAVDRPYTGDGVEHRGLAGSVAADDGHEVARLKVEGEPCEGFLFIYRALIEGLADIIELKHGCPPLRAGA